MPKLRTDWVLQRRDYLALQALMTMAEQNITGGWIMVGAAVSEIALSHPEWPAGYLDQEKTLAEWDVDYASARAQVGDRDWGEQEVLEVVATIGLGKSDPAVFHDSDARPDA